MGLCSFHPKRRQPSLESTGGTSVLCSRWTQKGSRGSASVAGRTSPPGGRGSRFTVQGLPGNWSLCLPSKGGRASKGDTSHVLAFHLGCCPDGWSQGSRGSGVLVWRLWVRLPPGLWGSEGKWYLDIRRRTAGRALPRWVTTDPPSLRAQGASERRVSPRPRAACQKPRVLGFRRLLSGGQVGQGGVPWGDLGPPGHTVVCGVSEAGGRDWVLRQSLVTATTESGSKLTLSFHPEEI